MPERKQDMIVWLLADNVVMWIDDVIMWLADNVVVPTPILFSYCCKLP